MSAEQKLIQSLLELADIKINGSREWDIQVYNQQFYKRILAGGILALGESYMDGWWDCKALDEIIFRILRVDIKKNFQFKANMIVPYVKARLFNMQSKALAQRNVEHHYDIGNDLYKLMLDQTMTYSCGYWKIAKNLNEAQLAKYDLICKKAQLKKGMTVLDIGCGWGGFAKYAATNYGVNVTGITLSKEQAKIAKERTKNLPVTIKIMDYRDLNETFDAIISIGMFEHVGPKNYETFFETASKNLTQDGLMVLHTIGGTKTRIHTDPWVEKYIFPNGRLPSPKQISIFENYFVLEDWHNFGADYDKTLMAWYVNFQKNLSRLPKKYDKRFQRMWTYYLLAFAGSFRARHIQLWQLVLSKKGLVGGYLSAR